MGRVGRAAVALTALGVAGCGTTTEAPQAATRHLVQDSRGGNMVGCAELPDPCPLMFTIAQADGLPLPLHDVEFDLPDGSEEATIRAKVACAMVVFSVPPVWFEAFGRLETRGGDSARQRILVVTGLPDDFMRGHRSPPYREHCESIAVVSR